MLHLFGWVLKIRIVFTMLFNNSAVIAFSIFDCLIISLIRKRHTRLGGLYKVLPNVFDTLPPHLIFGCEVLLILSTVSRRLEVFK